MAKNRKQQRAERAAAQKLAAVETARAAAEAAKRAEEQATAAAAEAARRRAEEQAEAARRKRKVRYVRPARPPARPRPARAGAPKARSFAARLLVQPVARALPRPADAEPDPPVAPARQAG